MLFKETVAVYCKKHTEDMNGRSQQELWFLLMLKQVVYTVDNAN
jgi:hypothetical protein